MSSAEVRCQNSSVVSGCRLIHVVSVITPQSLSQCSFNNSVRLLSDHSKQQQQHNTPTLLDDVHSHKSEPPTKKKLGPWRPLKRLSRCEMDHMRYLRELQPDEWTHDKLSKMFGVSSSAVKRILRSKFDPSSEVEERQDKKAEQQKLKRKEQLLERTTNSKRQQLE